MMVVTDDYYPQEILIVPVPVCLIARNLSGQGQCSESNMPTDGTVENLPTVNSYVCVRNREARRSLSLETCYVGRVKKIFKFNDTWSVSVKLYLRPTILPPGTLKFNYDLDNRKDIISDCRGCISKFDVDDIFSKCEVDYCDPSCDLDTKSLYSSNRKPQFWIRYRLVESPTQSDLFMLQPVIFPSKKKMVQSNCEVLTPQKQPNSNTKLEPSDNNEIKSQEKLVKSSMYEEQKPSEASDDVKENNPLEDSPKLGSPTPSERLLSRPNALSPRSGVRRSLDLETPIKSESVATDSENSTGSMQRKQHSSKAQGLKLDEESNNCCKEENKQNQDDRSPRESTAVRQSARKPKSPNYLEDSILDSQDTSEEESKQKNRSERKTNNTKDTANATSNSYVEPKRSRPVRDARDSTCKAESADDSGDQSFRESTAVRRSGRKRNTPKYLADSEEESAIESKPKHQPERKSNSTKYMPNATLESDKEAKPSRHVRNTRASTCMAESTDDSDFEQAQTNLRPRGRKSAQTFEELVQTRNRKRLSSDANDQVEPLAGSTTPKRRFSIGSPTASATPLAQRTPSKTPKSSKKTPKSSKKTPAKSPRTPKTKTPSRTPSKGSMTPSLPARASAPLTPKTSLEQVRKNLHVSAVPMSLPCRELEYRNIYNFVENKIRDAAGGCMYISGVPGTGKTATVHAVVRALQEEVNNKALKEFQFIEVNGLRMTEPKQVFVQVLKSLTGQKCTPQHAQDVLAQRFCSGSAKNKTVVLLVDEVDMLRNRRQDVIYNLFDWPSKPNSRFIVLTIANTMDLPERLLKGRVTSRLGLTRLTFQPYSYKQLQEIVMSRLHGSDSFNVDAVELVARKVAACSGDVRRALDICRRASELVVEGSPVTMPIINQVLSQMMNSANVCSIRNCSRLEKLFLQAVVAENERTGVEETTFISVYRQYQSLCALSSVSLINISEAMSVLNRLGTSGLLLTEHSRMDINQSIFLNVSADDIHYALSQPLQTS